MEAVALSASILSPKVLLNLMSSPPSSSLSDLFFPNLDDHSLPVLNNHDQNPVTGDDEEEQRLYRDLQFLEPRANETVVCF